MAAGLAPDDGLGTWMWSDILYFLSSFSFTLLCSTSIQPCSVPPQLLCFVTLRTELKAVCLDQRPPNSSLWMVSREKAKGTLAFSRIYLHVPGQGEVRFDLDERKVRFGAEPTQESGTVG